MAKKGVSRKAKAVRQPVQLVKQEKPKSPVSVKAVTMAVLALLVAITVVEVIGIMKANLRAGKKPGLIAHWKPGSESTGLTSMYVYGQNLYNVDATRGTMLKYDVMTGKYLQKYALEQGLRGMTQLSNGDLLVISSGNTVVRFVSGGDKPSPAVAIEGCNALSYIAADSKDNVLALDSGRNVVIRCDSNLKKISEFGKGSLEAARRLFVGPQDSVYVLDAPEKKLMVKIFSADGSLKKKFRAREIKSLSNFESFAITPEGQVYINNMSGGFPVLCYGPDGSYLGGFSSVDESGSIIVSPAGIAGGMDGRFALPAYEFLILKNIKY